MRLEWPLPHAHPRYDQLAAWGRLVPLKNRRAARQLLLRDRENVLFEGLWGQVL